jgi:hypothetical protein
VGGSVFVLLKTDVVIASSKAIFWGCLHLFALKVGLSVDGGKISPDMLGGSFVMQLRWKRLDGWCICNRGSYGTRLLIYHIGHRQENGMFSLKKG